MTGSVCVKEICNSGISDHFPVLFTLTLPGFRVKSGMMVLRQHAYTPQIESQFPDAFIDSGLQSLLNFSTSTAEEMYNLFNSTCMDIMDLIAPFMTRHHKPTFEPLLNSTNRLLRWACRRAERKWKKDGLEVSLDIWREIARTQFACVQQ